MLIAYTLEHLGQSKVRVSWNGTAAFVAWIFVNGLLVDGPRYFDALARSVDLTVPDPFNIEVHETAQTEIGADAVAIPLLRKPTLWWSMRTGALRYIIRHTPPGEAERALASIPHQPDQPYYVHRLLQDLRRDGGRWNAFRIEAVNGREVESVRDAIPLFVAGLPKKPTALTVAGAAGVFTLTVGVA